MAPAERIAVDANQENLRHQNLIGPVSTLTCTSCLRSSVHGEGRVHDVACAALSKEGTSLLTSNVVSKCSPKNATGSHVLIYSPSVQCGVAHEGACGNIPGCICLHQKEQLTNMACRK